MCGQDVLAVVDRELPQFNAVNLATAVSRMAKQQAAPDAIMHAAVQPAFTRLKTAISAPHPCINPCSAPDTFMVGLQRACPVSSYLMCSTAAMISMSKHAWAWTQRAQ